MRSDDERSRVFDNSRAALAGLGEFVPRTLPQQKAWFATPAEGATVFVDTVCAGQNCSHLGAGATFWF